MVFIMLFSQYTHFGKSFHHEWMLSNAFSASIEMIMWFLTFLLFMWCMMFIDLRMLNHPCEPGMNPTWLWLGVLYFFNLPNVFPMIILELWVRRKTSTEVNVFPITSYQGACDLNIQCTSTFKREISLL